MSKSRRKKNASEIIFWIIGIEMVIAAIVLAYFAIRYAAPIASQAMSLLGKNNEQSQSVTTSSQAQSETLTDRVQTESVQQTQAAKTDSLDLQQSSEAKNDTENALSNGAVGEVRLVAAGDNLMHRSSTLSAKQADGSYDFTNNFVHMASIFQPADIAALSQDTVIGGESLGLSSSDGIFNTVTELAGGLSEAGIDIVLAANNHILDEGKTGVDNMLAAFNDYPEITLLGLNESEPQKYSPVYFKKNNITFALINYTNSTNENEALDGQNYLLNMYGQEWLSDVLSQAREYADFIIAFPYWGENNSLEITDDELSQAQFLADNGVDLIIGNGPHVVEPAKWITAENGDQTLVYYSLGNFQSIQNKLENMLGGLASVTITKTADKTQITACDLDFVVTHYEQQSADDYYDVVTSYPLEDYTEELAQRHSIKESAEPNFTKASLDGLSSSILSKSDLNLPY